MIVTTDLVDEVRVPFFGFFRSHERRVLDGLVLCLRSSHEFGLRVLDQFFDSARVCFAMAPTGDWIGPAGRFDQDFRPDEPGFDVHRRHLRDAHAHLIHPEQRPFPSRHRFVAHLDISRKEQVALGPAARFKNFNGHSFAPVHRREIKIEELAYSGQDCAFGET